MLSHSLNQLFDRINRQQQPGFPRRTSLAGYLVLSESLMPYALCALYSIAKYSNRGTPEVIRLDYVRALSIRKHFINTMLIPWFTASKTMTSYQCNANLLKQIRKRLYQKQAIPPLWRNQTSKPLVTEFTCDCAPHIHLTAEIMDFFIVQEIIFVVSNKSYRLK